MTPSFRIDDLVGVPYEIGGRGPSAYDCAGLVVECQRHQGIVVVIPGTGDSRISDHLRLRADLRTQWSELVYPVRGCVVFFPAEAHVGTMLDTRRFLHTTSEMGESYIESLDSPRWQRKRHRFFVFPGAPC